MGIIESMMLSSKYRLVEDSVIDALGLDVVDIGRTFDLEDKDWYPVKLADEEGDKKARMPEGATFFDQTNFPYIDDYPDDYSNLDTAMDKVLWQRLVHSPWSHADKPDFWETL